MPWLDKPYTELPPSVKLPQKKDTVESIGINEGDWIRWPNQNPQLPKNYFLHRDWYNSGFGFTGSKNMAFKLYDFIDKYHIYNIRGSLTKRNIDFKTVNYSDIYRTFPPNRHDAFYSYYGGTPCIVWQDPLHGWWNLSNYYGTIQGMDVKIHKSAEWQLRSRALIGYIYWYGKDRHSYEVNKNIVLSGKTGWNWNDVDIMLWGYYATKFDPGKIGIHLMKDRYLSLNPYAGKMMIGSHNAIPSDLLSNTKYNWTEWLVDRLREGRSIGWQSKRGFRYQAGDKRWTHVSLDEMRPVIDTVHRLGKL